MAQPVIDFAGYAMSRRADRFHFLQQSTRRACGQPRLPEALTLSGQTFHRFILSAYASLGSAFVIRRAAYVAAAIDEAAARLMPILAPPDGLILSRSRRCPASRLRRWPRRPCHEGLTAILGCFIYY